MDENEDLMKKYSHLFKLPPNTESSVFLLNQNDLDYYAEQFTLKFREDEHIFKLLEFYTDALKAVERSHVHDGKNNTRIDGTYLPRELYEAIRDALDGDLKVDEFQMFLLFDIIIQMIVILQLAIQFRDLYGSDEFDEMIENWDNQFYMDYDDTYTRWLKKDDRDAYNTIHSLNDNKTYNSVHTLMKRYINDIYGIKPQNMIGGAVQLHRRAQVEEQNRRAQLTRGEQQLEDERNIEKFDRLYDSILDEANFDKKDINRELLKKKLNVKPLKSKWMVYENGFYWMADTKVFGRDIISNGEVGLLVCIDASTRRCDAEPVLNVAQFDCIPAFIQILDRHIIQQGFPKIVMTDQGGEFGERFTRYCNGIGIKHRVSFAARKQQTSIVESAIGMITFGLMANLYKMRVQNRNTGQRPRQITQVDFLANGILPRIINKINAWASQKYPKPTKDWFNLEMENPKTDIRLGDLVLIKKN